MSSKIDGVPRELLERATDNKYIDKERISIYRHEALCSIRALLAAPVVERQPVDMQWQYEAGSAWWAFDAESVGDNIASGTKIRLTDQAGKVLFSYPAPELAELQATIDKLREGIAEHWKVVCDQRAEIEHLKGGQGEPVMKLEAERLYGGAGEYAVSFVKAGWLDECRKTGGEFLLYTSQPAPASVVLPELPVDWRTKFEEDQGSNEGGIASFSPDSYMQDEIDELRACLDKVKELNQ